MPRIGLGVPCPNCKKELTIEGGLTPSLVGQTISYRAAQGESVPVRCAECGSETTVGPAGFERGESQAAPSGVAPRPRNRARKRSPPPPIESENRSSTPRAGPWRIVIVEDHPIVRNSLVHLMSGEPDLEVRAACDTAGEAIRLVREHRPDAVLIDISLKEGNGLGLCAKLAVEHPELRMLILSAYDEALYANRALRAGARGFVGKGENTETLLDAIRSVLEGNVWLSERMREHGLSMTVPDATAGQFGMAQLSDRELEVFELLGHGLTSRSIAERLSLSPKTVETHRDRLKQKLGVETSTELTRSAIEWVLGGK